MKKKKLLKLINKSVVSLEHRGLELRGAVNMLHDHSAEVFADILNRLIDIERIVARIKRK
jgi:hypothetical protein